MVLTTENKVLLGIGGGAAVLYGVANFGTSSTTIDGVPTDDDGSSSGAPLWLYGIILVIVLALIAYTAREVAG